MMSNKQLTITYDPLELLKRLDPASKLELYYQLLLQENEKLNLVSRETGIDRSLCGAEAPVLLPKLEITGRTAPGSALHLLAAQSLLPFERIDINEIENYLDIGSGGGFPAIPILLTSNVKQTTLIERTKKKAGALRRILLALDIRATIISQSFEELSLDPVFDLVTLRLVKLTLPLFQRIYSVLRAGGFFVYYGVADFDLSAEEGECLTYHYSTATGESSGSFTMCKKV